MPSKYDFFGPRPNRCNRCGHAASQHREYDSFRDVAAGGCRTAGAHFRCDCDGFELTEPKASEAILAEEAARKCTGQ